MNQSLQCSRVVSAISLPVSEVPFGFSEDVLLHAAQCQVVLIVGRHTYAYSLHAKSIFGSTSVHSSIMLYMANYNCWLFQKPFYLCMPPCW